MDRTQFDHPAFDVTTWINKSCSECPMEDQLERYLAELEMKVQLIAEDTEASLHDSSADVVKHVTAANMELSRLQGDLLGIGDTVTVLASQVKSDELSCSIAVEDLRQLDLVKERMEASCTTIKEASELSSLCKNMETVINSGDITRMASDLAMMRRSLSALGKVPQFLGAADQLGLLETRLRELVEPALAEAMDHHNGDAMKHHWKVLVDIDKADLAQELYVQVVSTKLNATFIKHSEQQQGLLAWLPGWYAALLKYVRNESEWLQAVLPDQFPALLLQALSVTLKGFARPMLEALSNMHQKPEPLLEALVPSLHSTAKVSSDLGAIFHDVPHQVISSLTHPLLQPFEGFMADYSRLEASVLGTQMAQIMITGEVSSDLEDDIDALLATPAVALSHLNAALSRCHEFTGSLELPTLLPVLDSSLEGFFKRVASRISTLAASHVNAGYSAHLQSAADGVDVTTKLLQLPLLVVELQAASSEIESTVRARCTALTQLVAAASTGDFEAMSAAARATVHTALTDVVLWRITGSGREWKQLNTLQERMASVVLSASHYQLTVLRKDVDSLLLKRLTLPMAQALAEVDNLTSTWQAQETGTAGSNFSTYANNYATTVGEYLIMLPQLLEVLVPDDANPEADTLASQWLDKTVSAVADMVSEKVMALTQLGSKGSLQLATDLEYICNVIGALGVMLPSGLATASVLCTMLGEDEFKGCVASGLADGTLDRHASKILANMRGIDISGL